MPHSERRKEQQESNQESTGVKKNRTRSKSQRRKDKKQRDQEKVLDLHYKLNSLSDDAKNYIELTHLPVPEYGDVTLYNKSKEQKIVTIGNNPAPTKSEKDTNLTGPHVPTVMSRLLNSNGIQVPIEVQEAVLDAGHDYFMQKIEGTTKKHPYFLPNEKIGKRLSASYYNKENIHNFMLHIDLCPFSTTERWGKVPVPVQEELIRNTDILERIQYLKPTIVMFGVELLKVIHVFPGIRWKELARKEKKRTVVQVNWAIEKIKFVGRVLFIQTTPAPFPFLRVTDIEKEEIGDHIYSLAQRYNIGITQPQVQQH